MKPTNLLKSLPTFVVTLGLLLPSLAQATTYYVSTSGSDTAAGTSGAPWQTLAHACSAATNSGDVIQLGAGTFTETSQSYPASGVIIAGQGVSQTIVSGSASMANASGSYGSFGWTEQDAMIILPSLARGNTISNLTMDGNSRAIKVGVALTRHGATNYYWNNYTLDATNIVIHDVNFQNFTCMGLWLEEVQNAQVYNCNFNECGTDDPGTVLGALNLGGVRDSQIYNCNITNLTVASGYGIKLFDRPIQNTVLHDIVINVKPRSIWGTDYSTNGNTGGIGFNGYSWGNTVNFCMEAAHEDLINVEMYNMTLTNGAFSIVLGVGSVHNGYSYEGPGYALRFHDSRIVTTYGWQVELDGDAVQLDHNYFDYTTAGGTSQLFANYDLASTTLQGISVHHNVIEGVGNYVFGPASGLTNFGFYNNTVIYANPNTGGPFSVVNLGSGAGYTNLSFINNVFYCGGAGGSGSILSGAATNAPGLVYSNNCNFNAPFGNPGGGAAYGANLSVDPGLTLGAAAKPVPYYWPLNGSSAVIDAGRVIGGITTNYNGAAPDIGAYELNLTNTFTVLASSLNPSVSGNSVTFTATVLTNGGTVTAATGTVTFYDGTNVLGTGAVSGGQATLTTSGLAVGYHANTAVYGGNATYSASTSVPLIQTVRSTSLTATTTALGSSLNPATNGNSVTFTATVSPGAATGTVSFYDGATLLGVGTVSGGMATLTSRGLIVGAHSINAAYGGDLNYAGSTSATLAQTVNPAAHGTLILNEEFNYTNALGTVLSGTGASWRSDGPEFFLTNGLTYTNGGVLTTAGSAATETGNYFRDFRAFSGTTNTTGSYWLAFLVRQPIAASCNVGLSVFNGYTSPTNYGSEQVNLGQNISYGGGTRFVFNANLSSELTSIYTVGGNTTYLVVAQYNMDAGKTYYWINPVVGGAAPSTNSALNGPLGTVFTTFQMNAVRLGQFGGTDTGAVFDELRLGTNFWDVTPATSPATPAVTTTALGSSLNPSTNGNNVTFTATVQTNGVTAGGATGTVVFADNGTPLATNSVVAGVATYATSALSVGSHLITAVYGGDASYAGSTSSVLTQTVRSASLTSTTTALGSSSNPSTNGNVVTFTATVQTNGVTAGGATGTVVFADNGTPLATNSAVSGVATYATSALSVGLHTIMAAYGGNGSYAGSTSTTLTQTVYAVALTSTTTAMASSLNPSTNGNNVTFTATVTPSPATGTVVFSDNGTPLATNSVASGVATYATSALTVGTHLITAAYGGNGSYAGSTSTTLTQTVSGGAGIVWSVTNAISTADATLNQPGVLVGAAAFGGVAYTVTLTNGRNVNFTTDGSVATATAVGYAGQYTSFGFSGSGNTNFDAVLSEGEYDNGPHTITVTNLTSGHQYSVLLIGLDDRGNPLTSGLGARRAYFQDSVATNDVSATFLMGDNVYVKGTFTAAGSTQTILQQLPDGGAGNINVLVVYDVTSAAVPTTTALTSSLNPSTYGASVMFTATVKTNGVAATAATGSVVFSDGGTPLATNSLASGVATYATSVLTVGTHSMTAVYGGDANDAASTSGSTNQTVNKATPSITTVPSASSIFYGQTLVSSTLSGGVASTGGSFGFTTPSIAPNASTTNVSVTFTPTDTTDYTTASTTVTVTVNKATTTTGLASSLNPSTNGNNVTFTATVTPSAATGTVTFKDGATTLGTGTLSGGVATYATGTLSVGSHSITASYGGDANYSGSTASSLTQVVNAVATLPTTTALASSLNPSTNGNSVAFTATVQTNGVTAGGATGTVTFKDGATTLGTGTLSSGVATYATSTLGVGSHSITATYGGDASYVGSTSTTLTQTVVNAGTQIAWSSTNAITTADATLNQPGVLVGAAAFGGTAYTVTLTNGSNVNFTADGSVATTTGSYHQDNIFGFSGSGNANFDAVVSGAEYDAGPHTITVNNLTPGHQYSVLLIGLDDRSNPRTSGYGSRRAYFQDPAVTNDVSATFLMGDNMYVKGVFTAAASTQTIIQQLPDSGAGNINVLVVYDVTSLPSPWVSAAVGSVGQTGYGSLSNGVFYVAGAGAGVTGTADACQFVYQPATGNATNTVRVVSLQNSGSSAKAGVMIRETTAANAREAGMWVSPTNLAFTTRASTGGSTTTSTSAGKTAPYWVKVSRNANSFAGFYSTNGTAWTQLGSTTTITMSTNTLIGMGVTSGTTNTLNAAVMDNSTTIP